MSRLLVEVPIVYSEYSINYTIRLLISQFWSSCGGLVVEVGELRHGLPLTITVFNSENEDGGCKNEFATGSKDQHRIFAYEKCVDDISCHTDGIDSP